MQEKIYFRCTVPLSKAQKREAKVLVYFLKIVSATDAKRVAGISFPQKSFFNYSHYLFKNQLGNSSFSSDSLVRRDVQDKVEDAFDETRDALSRNELCMTSDGCLDFIEECDMGRCKFQTW